MAQSPLRPTLAVVEQLFPFCCTVDEQLRIASAGPALPKLLGPGCVGTRLTDHVSIDPLFGALDRAVLERTVGQLFIARHDQSGLRLRGQVLRLPEGDLLIAWSPWISSTAEFEATGLSMLDFGIQDPTLDMLHLLEAFERARAEAAEPLERLRRFFSTGPDLMAVLTATGRVVMANDASAEILGIAPEALVGKPLADALAPTSRPTLDGVLDRVHQGGPVTDVDVVTSGGPGPRTLRLSAAAEAQHGQVFVIARDVTQTEQMRQTAARILSSAPNAMLTVDQDGTITFANAEACAMFGYGPDALVGSGIERLVPDELQTRHAGLRARFVAAADQEYRHRMASDRDIEGRTSDGRLLSLQVTLTSIVMQGRAQTLASLIDIGARKQLEAELLAARDAALELAGAKSAFLANTSHEIRTPLTSVIGLTELLLQTDLTDEQREMVQTTRVAEGRLLALVDDILLFARAEAGRLHRDDISFSPTELVEECARIVAPTAEAKGVALIPRISPATPVAVLGDREKLRAVLLNLASNAVKFTDEGSITLALGWDAGTLTVDVTDTGMGIEPQRVPDLFEPFVQADPTTTRRFGGSGLGLAITRQMVTILGGTIEVQTEPGRGSTFRVAVPMPAADDVPTTETAPRAVGPGDLVGLAVLLVEDDPVNSTLISRMLARLGAAVQTRANGEEALEAIAISPFDVILMDCHMPVLDGFEATRRLRTRESQEGMGAHATVIALTASVLEEDRRRCLEAGMDSFLSKPVRLADLSRALAPYVGAAPS